MVEAKKQGFPISLYLDAAERRYIEEFNTSNFEAEVDNFQEVGAVGTAVVVTPIKSFTRGEKKWEMGQPTVLKELHDRVRAIQQGEVEDKHGWTHIVPIFDQEKKLLSVYPPL